MPHYDFSQARNFFSDKVPFTTGSHELEVMVNSHPDPDSFQVVDVRYPVDFAHGHVAGACPRANGRTPVA